MGGQMYQTGKCPEKNQNDQYFKNNQYGSVTVLSNFDFCLKNNVSIKKNSGLNVKCIKVESVLKKIKMSSICQKINMGHSQYRKGMNIKLSKIILQKSNHMPKKK